MKDLKRLEEYDAADQLAILTDICHSIYIARNITLSSDVILDNLKKLDRLFRDENFN